MSLADLLPDHLVAATEIYNHYVLHSTATFHEQPLSPDEFATLLPEPSDRHGSWAVVEDGTLAGFVYLGVYKPRSGYRDTGEVTVYLHPDHVGRGLGRQALAHAEAYGQRGGLHALLAGVCTENETSAALFRRSGYTEVARLREVGVKFGRRLDVIYLEKIFDASPNQPSR